MINGGNVGFIIPEYQRQYDWSEKNIKRMYYDILNGFQRLSGSANGFTFLGTIILVEEEYTERGFSGKSLAIVDGQQRLTTLALMACALCESLENQKNLTDLSAIKKEVSEWLKNQIGDRKLELYACAVGSQDITPIRKFVFPKIIRQGDARRKDGNSEYISPVGKFFEGFSQHLKRGEVEYIPSSLGRDASAEKLAKNFQLIRNLVGSLNDPIWYRDTECELFDTRCIERSQVRNLIGHYGDSQDETNQMISYLVKNENIHDLIRTLIFSTYFCKYIVLTRVKTNDESVAFDIFDALNTTGEPLTAIETLKPQVIKFEKEKRKGHYSGSISEMAFSTINECIDQRFFDTSKKQLETKELIVIFALYIAGKKLSKDLASQRGFLRTRYEAAKRKDDNFARKYVKALAHVAQFRRFYWEKKGIEELNRFHTDNHIDEIKLLVSFIYDMKTSLILPILARYWSPDHKYTNDQHFLQVLRAITSFLVLRRAATGSSAGIDSDFRAIMTPSIGRGSIRKFGLCLGVDHNRDILSIDEFKDALKTLLRYKLKRLDKDSWIKQVVANPLYSQSRDLVRFMIFAAANGALPSKNSPGTWEKSDIRESEDERNFLSYSTWRDERYSTVEHIAPETPPRQGWSRELYDDNIIRHSLGNLILLPPGENSAIGDASWRKKRKFYIAVTEITKQGAREKISEAKSAGIPFSQTITDFLNNRGRLSLLDPLRDVKGEWDRDIVLRRSKNIADLCWDVVRPWLD